MTTVDEQVPFPPAVNLDLSLSCANNDHDVCPGCDLCTCHDRGPIYTLAANLIAAAGLSC